jgi:hypothetical protein
LASTWGYIKIGEERNRDEDKAADTLDCPFDIQLVGLEPAFLERGPGQSEKDG